MSCPHCGTDNSICAQFTEEEKKNGIRIALAGNPNCGKTTAFNAFTGSRQHVGNYPGVTVEKKEGWAQSGEQKVLMVDLPGTYSLTAYSMEEIVTREVLAPADSAARPRAVIDVIDSATLERSLLLAVQIRELGLPVVLACNMMDEARKMGMIIDLERLGRRFGSRAVATVARSGEGLPDALRVALEESQKPCEPLVISYGPDLDPVLMDMTALISERGILTDRYPARWTAVKLLEGDSAVRAQVEDADADAARPLAEARSALKAHLSATHATTPDEVISDYRYGFINGVLKDGVVRKDNTRSRLAVSDAIDKVLTNVILGPVCMLAVLYFMFWATFELGAYPQGWVEDFFGLLGEVLAGVIPAGLFQSLVVDGIIGGVGGVMSFVPLIMIMFVFVSFLEDSGYMARMAYMLDRVMRVFGLHGSSVMPFIIAGGIAGGCAIPGVIATRTMRSEKEKMATMLTLPLMNCGAKIPVFLMLTAAFFAEDQAAIMFGVTLSGWVVALIVARFLRSTILRGESTPFVMELPPYRLPTLRSVVLHTWERGWMYIKKAGTVILAISVVLWAALTFPELAPEKAAPYEKRIEELDTRLATVSTQAATLKAEFDALRTQPEGAPVQAKTDLVLRMKELHDVTVELEAQKERVEHELASAETRNTFGGRFGLFVEPFFAPLGFDWRTDVALLAGVAAKEAVLSTMGTAYSIGEVDPEEAESLGERLARDPGWSKTVALALMLFVLIYSPCFVTLVVLKNEAGGWRWLFFSMIFNTAVAYAVAYIGTLVGRVLWG
ncbi:ferrous iron transport protein B [Mailhella sp.]|uniref:ferrous iron transport protein B n=1 Tax=Mailhella sp. TaxID=1981029 RepID=UPI0040648E28